MRGLIDIRQFSFTYCDISLRETIWYRGIK